MDRPELQARVPDHAPTLLGVFAHPDDEQFGTAGALLTCADRGIAVQIAAATSGDAGEISDPTLATRETLAAVREQELRAACSLLGFAAPVFWRYPDGGLAGVDPDRLRDDVLALIRRLRPRVVVTFDANGGYGHPDHIAIHRATIAAMTVAGEATIRSDLGPPHMPDKLYATAYPRSGLAQANDDLARHGLPHLDFGDVQTVAFEELGTPDDRITTVVPVAHLWQRRWASLRAHRTQYGADSPLLLLPEAVVRSWATHDRFVRLRPRPAPGITLPDESDLWQGLPLPAPSATTHPTERI